MICLDTNYLIRGLVSGSREGEELAAWITSGERLVTPVIAWYEFLCGPVTARQVETMRAFVSALIAFDASHAVMAAALYNAVGRKRRLRVDAMIAAVAIVAGASLATSNQEDFCEFVGHGLLLA